MGSFWQVVHTVLASLMKTLGPIVYTVFGWILGIVGTFVLQSVNRKKRKNDFEQSLCAEFREVISQLAGTHYLLRDALGELDRDVLNWTQTMLSKFPQGYEKPLKSIGKLLKRSDDDLKALAAQTKASKRETMSIKKITLPFLQQNLSSISLLSPNLQRSVAAIQRYINSLNEEIDLYYFYFKKTFNSTLTEKNYELVNKNIDHAYQVIADLSYKTAECVLKTISDFRK